LVGDVLTVFILTMLVIFAGSYFYFQYKTDDSQNIENFDEIYRTPTEPDRISPLQRFFNKSRKLMAKHTHIPLTIGNIAIYDIAGNEIANIVGAVSESGWVAIPAHQCIGGHRWFFNISDKERVEIVGGIFGDHDDIGLWQLENIDLSKGPQLYAAQPAEALTWISIRSDKKILIKETKIRSDQQNIIHLSLPAKVDEPGVLMQEDKIVGWTFGSLIDGGYIWKGPSEDNLVYELSVSDFYRMTFENSREEQFIIAYALDNSQMVKKIEYFVKGFLLDPMLFDENTPSHLKPEAVINEMRSLMSQITHSHDAYEAASIFNSTALANTGDPLLVEEMLTYVAAAQGPESAMDLLENILAEIGQLNESGLKQLEKHKKELYVKWLTILADNNNYSEAFEVFNRAAGSVSGDPEIQLIGVKLSLAFNDWETAEKLLESGSFPIDLSDQVRRLKGQIAELKYSGQKIIVRFIPGTGKIPVSTIINNSFSQDFLVDTGASYVTIPSKAVESLGLEIDRSVPMQKLITAAGVIEAPLVNIDAITLNGWTEFDIQAYVVDMPNKSGLGLLGLNYLNRFRMDLNTQAGVLMLEPR
jgi:clan AA aspartic protease (TIGR02281 family)